tara:strand:+ start:300 stop:692 length:393 start_codon:yes stop_codon:yes gene_type:complete
MFNMNIARFTYPIWGIFILTSVGLSNCRYDNKHDLYGNPNACDTSAVTFSQDIKMIIGQNCERCHNGAFANGGLNLVGHQNISTSALSGAIMDRVTRGAGDPLLMPPGEALSDCDQSKLRAWINEDAPNN